jgi:hypothetical protein
VTGDNGARLVDIFHLVGGPMPGELSVNRASAQASGSSNRPRFAAQGDEHPLTSPYSHRLKLKPEIGQ